MVLYLLLFKLPEIINHPLFWPYQTGSEGFADPPGVEGLKQSLSETIANCCKQWALLFPSTTEHRNASQLTLRTSPFVSGLPCGNEDLTRQGVEASRLSGAEGLQKTVGNHWKLLESMRIIIPRHYGASPALRSTGSVPDRGRRLRGSPELKE